MNTIHIRDIVESRLVGCSDLRCTDELCFLSNNTFRTNQKTVPFCVESKGKNSYLLKDHSPGLKAGVRDSKFASNYVAHCQKEETVARH